MNIIKLSVSTVIILGTLTGCGTGPELTPQQQKELHRFHTSDVADFGKVLHNAMNQDELLFYAPVSMENAKDAYQEALEAESKDEKLVAYEQAQNALKHAYVTKKQVIKYLADVADIKKRMDIQNTKDIFPDRYQDFLDDYKDLRETIDNGEVSEALEDKKEVLEDAKDLYGDAVVYRNINKAKVILERMEDDDLDKLAPSYFEKAQTLYENAREKIKQEPDNRPMIERLSEETNEAALFAQTLAKDVHTFRELDKDEQEAFFAKIHKKLATLNPDEEKNSILPFPLYEKIDILQEMYKSSSYTAPKRKTQTSQQTN